MKPARIIVLGVALVAGGLAAYLVSGSRAPEPPKQAPAPPPLATVEVLVAKSDLAAAQVIADRDLGWQVWPADAANPSFIKKSDRPNAINDFVGAIVRTPIAAGEPIRASKVVTAKGSGFMAAILPHGMRAVSLEVSPTTGAGGFILPNDHVDVVLTRRDRTAEKSSGTERFVSETILRNVRVLAIDQTVAEKDGEKVAVGKTATIELTPQQAETLALARQTGTISLTLRSLVDSQSQVPEGGDKEAEDGRTINTVRYGVTTQTVPR
ncbi:MAG TPA: Flp pilus assembly protein CpaB [Xanthobacteraceae bacterium]|nr:Flp pilus assembly protein CpaB [Xanthobacteraceae bacterium]